MTVPINGYSECEFIHFARTKEEFSSQIKHAIHNPIDKANKEYQKFFINNRWSTKAKDIIYRVSLL